MPEPTTFGTLIDHTAHCEQNLVAKDPLDSLDQQWEQERIGYVGKHNADPRIKLVSSSMFGSLLCVVLIYAAMTLRTAIDQADIRFYLATLLLTVVYMLLGFGLRGSIRLRLAERRYLKQRAALAKALNRPSKPKLLIPKQRISSPANPYANQWTAAEQQIYALQEAHYAEPKRDKHYHATIQRIIVDAPKAEQAYLTELVQLEQRWLSERLRYRNIKPDYYYHPERPDEDGSYTIRFAMNSLVTLLIGLGIAGFGIWLVWKYSAALLNGMAFIAMGVVFMIVAWETKHTTPNLHQAEQRYLQHQYALAQKYGRLHQ
ncbi:tetraspanin family protein [Herpetosiphon llansteffanensis]|uniref:tetraspanin family protein n=1 Tax=Herpetosiphon llansteffanensis TaxID=2094568 RepID=UPI000D7C62AA|nr:tetraspanin family protein [Herpetosiphon llansteffanensis]